jgi:formylmethanofuran dehydrogenase subunit A
VINAGGAAAFKANVREFSFDDVVPNTACHRAQSMRTLQRGA